MSNYLERDAKERGISHASLRRARAQLGVIASRRGFGTGSQWVWHLPARREDAGESKMLTSAEGAHVVSLSPFAEREPLRDTLVPSRLADPLTPGAQLSNPPARRPPALPDVAFPADGGLASDAVGGPLGTAALAGNAAAVRGAGDAGDICPVTGGAHVYAQMRDARGRPVCVACQRPGPRPAA